MVILQKIVFVHWVLCQFCPASAPRFWAFPWGGARLGRCFVGPCSGQGRAGRPFFSQGGSQRGGASNRSSLICSLLPKTSILLDHPWLTGLSSEHRHQTLSQFPPLGVLTFACICSFLSLDLRGFCRIPSICRKGAKRAHGQGDETD